VLSRRKTHVDDAPDEAWPRMCEMQAAAWERLARQATTEDQRERAWLRVEVWTVHAHDARNSLQPHS